MDFGRSFTYMMEDQDWIKKLGIGAVMALLSPLLGITALPLTGYMVAIVREKLHGGATALPEWDFGQAFKDGVFVAIIEIVYLLPASLFYICGGVAYGGLSSAADPTMLQAAPIVAGCVACVGIAVGFVAFLLIPMAIGRYADTGEIGAAFQIGELVALTRNNIAGVLILAIGYSLAIFIIVSLSLVVCLVGQFAAIPYAVMVAGDGVAQVYQGAQG